MRFLFTLIAFLFLTLRLSQPTQSKEKKDSVVKVDSIEHNLFIDSKIKIYAAVIVEQGDVFKRAELPLLKDNMTNKSNKFDLLSSSSGGMPG